MPELGVGTREQPTEHEQKQHADRAGDQDSGAVVTRPAQATADPRRRSERRHHRCPDRREERPHGPAAGQCHRRRSQREHHTPEEQPAGRAERPDREQRERARSPERALSVLRKRQARGTPNRAAPRPAVRRDRSRFGPVLRSRNRTGRIRCVTRNDNAGYVADRSTLHTRCDSGRGRIAGRRGDWPASESGGDRQHSQCDRRHEPAEARQRRDEADGADDAGDHDQADRDPRRGSGLTRPWPVALEHRRRHRPLRIGRHAYPAVGTLDPSGRARRVRRHQPELAGRRAGRLARDRRPAWRRLVRSRVIGARRGGR